MIESIIAAASLLAALYDIISKHIKAWKFLQKRLQEQIKALKAETMRNIGIIRELEKEDLKGPALHSPAIRKLISRLSCTEAGKVSREFDLVLGKRLKKQAKTTVPKNDPVRVFFAIKDAAEKIAELKDRAVLAAKPAPHATRTILSRRVPAIRKKLDIIAAALAPIPLDGTTPKSVKHPAKTPLSVRRLPQTTRNPALRAGKGGPR
jgi:hypothetical protein